MWIFYAVFASVCWGMSYAASGILLKKGLSPLLFFFGYSLICTLGAYMTYVAMAAKNPTLASLIEISYPLFVVLFTWLFFREFQLNMMTLCGGLLVLIGVAVFLLGER